ncbi:MAG: hypothetical protein KAU31_08495 [Spirochaetaceae bacterium]|nr:hypothetical protein [Spirochaetaceae bacterium]
MIGHYKQVGSSFTPLLIAVVLFGVVAAGVHAQQVDMNQLAARDELRWGVTSYHAGNLNQSIVSLNRSLAFDSSQSLTRHWLGRAYYASGFEEAALSEWRWLVDQGFGTTALRSWIDRTELQRGLTPERLGEELTPGRLVTMAEVPGVQGDVTIFRRPAMIRPRNDGYFYVASFATHQILLMDPNGVRKQLIDGGLEGFDRPFDVLLLDTGELLVSEFGADRIARISPGGFKIGSFGGTGLGDGQLLGPQYLTSDGKGYLYVSDYGNQRIVKFSTDGEFVLSFGEPLGRFSGLREPTGLTYHAGRIYVSDVRRNEILVFDESGNYIGSLVSGQVDKPEALSVYRDGILLVADANRLYALQIESERLDLLAELAPQHRLIGAVADANGNVLVSDFQSDLLLFLAPSEELYTGLTVEVDHVIASDHPEIFVAVNVTDRKGNPLLGLDSANFRITEDRFPVGRAVVTYAGYRTGEIAVAVIADRTMPMAGDTVAVQQAALELSGAISPVGKRWLVTAGEDPLVEASPEDGVLAFSEAAVGSAADYGRSSLDLAIRLAGRQVLRELDRRSVILITDGTLPPTAFDNFGLIETASFLRNNHITFNVVYTQRNQSTDEIEYLVEATGGQSVFVFQPAGLGTVIDELVAKPSGTYLLSYNSVHYTDFGRRYIPLEVEAYLLRRSGRDEAGYYGPLEF